MTTTLKLHIRWLTRRDMPDVLAIEDASHGEMWNEEDFLRALRQRNCIGMVAEHDESIVSFMVYELQTHRLDVVNFAVHPKWRRMGVGSQMLAKLVGKLSGDRRVVVRFDVRDDNLTMQMFLKRGGFRAESVRGDRYRMVYRISGEEEAAEAANRVAALLGEDDS